MLLPVSDISRSIIYGLAVFGNALALNLVVPIAILVYNVATVPFGELAASPMMALTGYKANIESLRGRHVRLMHKYEETPEGKPEIKRTFSGSEINDETYERIMKWESEGIMGRKSG